LAITEIQVLIFINPVGHLLVTRCR